MTNTKTIQLNQLKQAETLINECKYDQALDLLTSGRCGSNVAIHFLSEYIAKWELMGVSHIKDSKWGNEYKFDQLNNDEWYRCASLNKETSTAYITRAGGEMLADVINFIAIA